MITRLATFVTTETRKTQRMGVIQVVTVRRDESRPWELTTSHMVHTVMLHGVVHNIVPFIVELASRGLLTT